MKPRERRESNTNLQSGVILRVEFKGTGVRQAKYMLDGGCNKSSNIQSYLLINISKLHRQKKIKYHTHTNIY
jgi:hypothetical protein